MRLAFSLSLLFLLGIFTSSLTARSVPGFILTPSKHFQSKDNTKETLYHDKNVKDLIAHNLGMFETVSDSSFNIISNLGSKNLLTFQKLNYVFLLEGNSSQNLNFSPRRGLKHEASQFDICSDEESGKCLINHLFSKKNQNSVLNTLKKFTQSQVPEAYIFSNDENLDNDVSESRLNTAFSPRGNLFIMEKRSNQQFKIASSLQSCVNSLFSHQFNINLEEGVIQSANNAPLVFESAKEDFVQYMSDLCSVVGVSTLIRKDPNPSFFAFSISSLGRLEKFVSKEQSAVLYQMFNIAYEQFMKNILTHYEIEEVSGQVFLLDPSTTSVKLPIGRLLQEEENPVAPEVSDEPSTKTITVIFRSLFIAFVFVIAWVCIEMFTMDIQKDSVVYAKFLAADYFRR